MLSVLGSVGLFSALGVKSTLIIMEVIPFLVLAVSVVLESSVWNSFNCRKVIYHLTKMQNILIPRKIQVQLLICSSTLSIYSLTIQLPCNYFFMNPDSISIIYLLTRYKNSSYLASKCFNIHPSLKRCKNLGNRGNTGNKIRMIPPNLKPPYI